MGERNGPPRLAQRAVNNSAAVQKIMLAQLSPPLFIASLREDRTPRPTTNLHRRSLDDCNHSFEWRPGVLSFVTNPQMQNPFEVQTIMPSPDGSQRVVRAPRRQPKRTNQ